MLPCIPSSDKYFCKLPMAGGVFVYNMTLSHSKWTLVPLGGIVVYRTASINTERGQQLLSRAVVLCFDTGYVQKPLQFGSIFGGVSWGIPFLIPVTACFKTQQLWGLALLGLVIRQKDQGHPMCSRVFHVLLPPGSAYR